MEATTIRPAQRSPQQTTRLPSFPPASILQVTAGGRHPTPDLNERAQRGSMQRQRDRVRQEDVGTEAFGWLAVSCGNRHAGS